MKISLTKIAEKLIWVLTVFLFVSFMVFETYTWGRYAFLAASVLILVLDVLSHRRRFTIRLERYHWHTLAFAGFTAFSALWALDSGNSLTQATTILLTLACSSMLYIHYKRELDIQRLLDAVRWTGFVVAIYAILFYGLDVIQLAAAGKRLDNDFSNVNTIGMAAALSCVIQIHEVLYGRSRKATVMMIPCVIMIAACQSRKALVLLLMGTFAVYVLKNRQSKNWTNKLFRMVMLLIGAVLLVSMLYSLPIFAGVRVRMDRMILGLLGQSGADSSTLLRQEMTELGWEWFLKNPLSGVGVGCPHILARRYIGRDTYLHNNFAELLCGGGLPGFCIYYSMYVYLFKNLWKYRQGDQKLFEIGLVWLVLMLFLDYGMVSYYSKQQWFYLMIHFLNVFHLKKNYMEKQYAAEKTSEGRL